MRLHSLLKHKGCEKMTNVHDLHWKRTNDVMPLLWRSCDNDFKYILYICGIYVYVNTTLIIKGGAVAMIVW